MQKENRPYETPEVSTEEMRCCNILCGSGSSGATTDTLTEEDFEW